MSQPNDTPDGQPPISSIPCTGEGCPFCPTPREKLDLAVARERFETTDLKSFTALYARLEGTPAYERERAKVVAEVVAERKKADDSEGGLCD